MTPTSFLLSTCLFMASTQALPSTWSFFHRRDSSYHNHNLHAGPSFNKSAPFVAGNVNLVQRDDPNVVVVYQTVTQYATSYQTVGADGSPNQPDPTPADSQPVQTVVVNADGSVASQNPTPADSQPVQTVVVNADGSVASQNPSPVNNQPATTFSVVMSSAPAPAPAPATTSSVAMSSAPAPAPATTSSVAMSSAPAPAPVPTTPASGSNSNSNSGSWSDFSNPGSDGMFSFNPTALSYTPFNNDLNNWCRSANDVLQDLRDLYSKGIREIRLYGTDCNSIQLVLPAAASVGLKVVQGFYISNAGANSIDNDVSAFVSWASSGGDLSVISSILIGNEAVTNGWISASDLVSKIASVRSQLAAVGYNGHIATAEIPGTYAANPQLCASSNVDYVAVNAHPYFDASSSPDQAGSFMSAQIQTVQNACSAQYVRVVETGYPHSGNTNGNQVPSFENQGIAVTQIYNALKGDCILFSMWDDHWKDPGAYNVEWYFGLFSRFNNA